MKKILWGMLFAMASFTVLSVGVASAAQEKTDGFICPVFHEQSKVGEHNPNAVPIGGGDYTILGPNVNVPVHATNQDGAGSPPGDHASPGDTGYSPIWNL